MSGELSVHGYKVDGPSQQMLRALRGGDWHYSEALATAAGLEDNRQVSYRMEHYLGPAGSLFCSTAEPRDDEQFIS